MASRANMSQQPTGQHGSLDAHLPPSISPPANDSVRALGASSSRVHQSSNRAMKRRNRMITSCLECRRRKLKCDRSHPCNHCSKGNRDCVFLSPALDQASQLRLTEIKERASSLHHLLETDVARTSKGARSSNANEDGPPSGTYTSHLRADETDLAPSPLVAVDAVYEDDDEDDDLLDLGIQIGKMRLTERIGGYFRPVLSSELEAALQSPKLQLSQASLRAQNQPYLMPTSAYIAPASGFFFGQTTHSALTDYLPSRQAADKLIQAYFTNVHLAAKILHKPSFEMEYESFWEEVHRGIEPSPSVQAIVFSTMFSGIVSMDEDLILRLFGVHKDRFITSLKGGTEAALCRAHFLRTTKVETLQAFVMYLIPLCRAEISRAHSVLVGSAIRLAECMGLHRDGENYGLNPLETQVRRLIWYQLCFLDVRTCEAQGPRPGVRKDDFDTQLPLNVDDIDIHASRQPPIERETWTDATFTRMRFEINEFMRFMWTERPRLQARKSTLTSVLSKMESFRKATKEKYEPLLDERIPLQRYAKLVKNVLLSRLAVMLLAPYHTAPEAVMPLPLRQILVSAALTILESAREMDTLPEIHSWAWLNGAFNQHHAAFLLLMDVTFFTPSDTTKIDRIWRCLDYVFETSPSDPPETKSQKILAEVQGKTATYQQLRRMRAPVAMVKHVNEAPRRMVDGSLAEPPGLPMPSEPRHNTLLYEAPVAIGKAPISSGAFLGMAAPHQTFPPNPQARQDAGGPSITDIPQPRTVDGPYPIPEIDWDVFNQLFPDNQDLLA